MSRRVYFAVLFGSLCIGATMSTWSLDAASRSIARSQASAHVGRPASAARSDPRHQRPRRPRLLPRAEVGARPARSLRRVAERARGRRTQGWSREREDGVLGQRLQRVRAADGRRSLSASRLQHRLPVRKHPPDSRRVRDDRAPRGGPERHARSRSRRRSCRSSRSRASTSRSAAAPIGSGRLRSEAYTGERIDAAARRHPEGVRRRNRP